MDWDERIVADGDGYRSGGEGLAGRQGVVGDVDGGAGGMDLAPSCSRGTVR